VISLPAWSVEKIGIAPAHFSWSVMGAGILRGRSFRNVAIEKSFRQTQERPGDRIPPLRHWADGKIRCLIPTCIAALTIPFHLTGPAIGDDPRGAAASESG